MWVAIHQNSYTLQRQCSRPPHLTNPQPVSKLCFNLLETAYITALPLKHVKSIFKFSLYRHSDTRLQVLCSQGPRKLSNKFHKHPQNAFISWTILKFAPKNISWSHKAFIPGFSTDVGAWTPKDNHFDHGGCDLHQCRNVIKKHGSSGYASHALLWEPLHSDNQRRCRL